MRPTERGVALVVALTLLLFTSIIALSAVRYSALAMRVATNTEQRISAFQTAQSIVDATVADPGNTPVSTFDATNPIVACSSTSDTGCSGKPVITLPNSYLASEVTAQKVKIKVKRLSGSTVCPRAFGNETDFYCAQFAVESTYDPGAITKSEGAAGKSLINEGIIVPYN